MSVVGMITEYNPFHNGHLFHLTRAKEITGAQYALCVMSGNFVQRGEPAIVDKWARTRMALAAGVDLVIELPVVYTLQSAEGFARGGISLLDALGVVDFICFGSEAGDIQPLKKIAGMLESQPVEYRALLKDYLKLGLSFADARQRAAFDYFEDKDGHNNPSIHLNSPNNILAIEYIKALMAINSDIYPVTVKRIGAGYDAERLSGPISSATAIRQFLHNGGNLDDTPLNTTLPDFSRDILRTEFEKAKGPVSLKAYDQLVLSIIRRSNPRKLSLLPDVSEGLENKLYGAAFKCGSLDGLLAEAKTKRYAYTRLQRILMNMILGITAREIERFDRQGGPQYIRILGFNKNSLPLLKMIKMRTRLPIITKAAHYKKWGNKALTKMFEKDVLATDIYSLAFQNPKYRTGGRDFTTGVIIKSA
ncbi:MAG TPA: nucleotidyltransferase [Clostridiales bacterium]|nr:nucleotidyltransferase [Clostridiales bacterium]